MQKTNPNPTSQAPPPPPADCRASRLLAHAPSDSSDEGGVEGPGSGGGFLWRASCPRLGDTPQYYCPDPLVFQVKPRSLGSCTQGLQRTCRVQEHGGVGTLRHGLLWPSAPREQGRADSRGGRTPPPPSLRLRPGLKPGRSQRLGYEGSQLVLPKSSSVPLLSPAWTPRGKGRGRTSVLRGGCLFFPPRLGAEVQSQQSSCPELSRGQKSSGGGVASGQALREVAIKRARGKSATEVPRGKAGRGSPREGRRQERLDGACLSPTPREGGALPQAPSCPPVLSTLPGIASPVCEAPGSLPLPPTSPSPPAPGPLDLPVTRLRQLCVWRQVDGQGADRGRI